MKKFCTRCGNPFEAVGREVICPACKQAAAEETKRAAVMRAKRASWTGESVPVRISGRASTVIREFGAANGLPFAAALDALLQASDYFGGMQMAWEDITPYKSHRRDKHTTEDAQDGKQDAPQDVTSKPQDTPQDTPQASKPQDTPQTAQAAKVTSKASTASKTSKTKTSKTKTSTAKKSHTSTSKKAASATKKD